MVVPSAVCTSTSPVAMKLVARFGGDIVTDTVTKEASNKSSTAIFRASPAPSTNNLQRALDALVWCGRARRSLAPSAGRPSYI